MSTRKYTEYQKPVETTTVVEAEKKEVQPTVTSPVVQQQPVATNPFLGREDTSSYAKTVTSTPLKEEPLPVVQKPDPIVNVAETQKVSLSGTGGTRKYTEYQETPNTRAIVEAEKQEILSKSFYTKVGYPELAGKYPAFDVPSGLEVVKIEEQAISVPTPVRQGREGSGGIKNLTELKVTLAPKEIDSPKSLSQRYQEFVGNKPTGVIKEPYNPLKTSQAQTRSDFVSGAIGAFEGFVYGIVRGGALVIDLLPEKVRLTPKGQATEFVEKHIPKPPPSVIGGVIGKGIQGLTGIESNELEEATKSPAYAVGNVFGDVLLSTAISVGIKEVRGGKVTKLVGAKETELTKGTGTSLKTTKTTQYFTQAEKVPFSEAQKLKEFARYTTPKKVGLSGWQLRAEQYVDDTTRIVSKGSTTWRDASPIIETVRQASKPSLKETVLRTLHLSKSKVVGITAKEFGDETFTYSSKAVGIATAKGKAFVLDTRTMQGISQIYPYGSSVAKKTLSAFAIEGSIDPQVYLGLVKAVGSEVAQKWYPQMGGISTSLLGKAVEQGTVSGVKVVTSVVGVQVASGVLSGLAGVGGTVAPKFVKAGSSLLQVVPTIVMVRETSNILSNVPQIKPLERLSPYVDVGVKSDPAVGLTDFSGISPIIRVDQTKDIGSVVDIGSVIKIAQPKTVDSIIDIGSVRVDQPQDISSVPDQKITTDQTITSIPTIDETTIIDTPPVYPDPVPSPPVLPDLGKLGLTGGGGYVFYRAKGHGRQKRQYPIKGAIEVLKDLGVI